MAYKIIRISYFVLLSFLSAKIKVDTQFIPFSLQSVAAVVAGFYLGRRDGMWSQIVYTALGLLGLPFFANGGGLSYAAEPSFGYVIGMSFAAFTAGYMLRETKVLSVAKVFVSGLVAVLTIYIVGVPYQVGILVLVKGMSLSAAVGSLFVVPLLLLSDILEVLLLALIYPKALTMIQHGIEEKSKAKKVDINCIEKHDLKINEKD